jgi:hypothetical protein
MLSYTSLDKNFATTLVLKARQPVRHLHLTRTPREIVPLDKATNEAANTNPISAARFITVLTADTTEPKL